MLRSILRMRTCAPPLLAMGAGARRSLTVIRAPITRVSPSASLLSRTAAGVSASVPAHARSYVSGPARISESPLTDRDDDTSNQTLVQTAHTIDPPREHGTLIWLHGLGEKKSKVRLLFEMLAPEVSTR
jgi:hypothetical protein